MASNIRITNISNGCRYKRGHIERAIAACAVEWVEHGISVRSLTLEESIHARKKQAAMREDLLTPLPFAETPGLRFEPPASGITATLREGSLVWRAHDWLRAMAESELQEAV